MRNIRIINQIKPQISIKGSRQETNWKHLGFFPWFFTSLGIKPFSSNIQSHDYQRVVLVTGVIWCQSFLLTRRRRRHTRVHSSLALLASLYCNFHNCQVVDINHSVIAKWTHTSMSFMIILIITICDIKKSM